MSASPRLSVIVPAHRAEATLPRTLAALRGGYDPGVPWELIVVDDGSGGAATDEAARLARAHAARLITLDPPPGGPGRARNAGADVAAGEWLVFVDADVVVHADTLHRLWQAITAHPEVGAVFGAYDDRVADQHVVSRYRNLLHRRVHLLGAGEAETFWAGLGAVRRVAFRAVNGFDAPRFPRPQIEDIDLGYRLRDAGTRILLEPAITGTHLKQWRLGQMVRTDFRDRAVPWMRLLLSRRGRTRASLNVSRAEQVKVSLAAATLVAATTALLLTSTALGWGAAGLLTTLLVSNLPTWIWFARTGGPGVAAVAVPLQLWHYGSNAVAVVVAVAAHLASPPSVRSPESHA
jgi:glycosyltransferase involved in cell wall biosynthesis